MLLLGGFTHNTASWCQAEKLPEAAYPTLEEILEQEEFQPRDIEPSWYEQLRDQLFAYGIRWLRDIWRSIDKFLSDVQVPESVSSLASPILWFFEQLWQLLKLIGTAFRWLGEGFLWVALFAAFAGAVYLLLRISRRFIQNYTAAAEDDAPGATAPVDDTRSVEELLRNNLFLSALSALRKKYRKRFHDAYDYHNSLSDREIIRLIPETDRHRALFKDIAELFERVVFAKKPLIPEELQTLAGRCLDSSHTHLREEVAQ